MSGGNFLHLQLRRMTTPVNFNAKIQDLSKMIELFRKNINGHPILVLFPIFIDIIPVSYFFSSNNINKKI